MNLAELKLMKIGELVALGRSLKVEGYSALRKQELIFAILKAQSDKDGKMRGARGFLARRFRRMRRKLEKNNI